MGLRRRSCKKDNNVQTTQYIKNWNALYVNSRAEKKVCELLVEKNLEAYVPLVKTVRLWSDRKKMVELPLINSYVFVCIKDAERDKVLQTRGVVNFVRQEGKIAIIRNIEMEQLKQVVELGYHLKAEPLNREFQEGEKVKINFGVLKNFEGYVTGKDHKNQFEIALTGIGYSVKVRLPQEVLETA